MADLLNNYYSVNFSMTKQIWSNAATNKNTRLHDKGTHFLHGTVKIINAKLLSSTAKDDKVCKILNQVDWMHQCYCG